MRSRLAGLVLLALVAFSGSSAAQGWETDARAVGLGGIGGGQDLFTDIVSHERGDATVGLPLGLIQMLRNRQIFDPGSPEFDPVRGVQYASNPFHIEFGRSASSPGARFVHDLRNGSMSPDLNLYSGFAPAPMTASGTVTPKWGHVFAIQPSAQGTQHAVYAGAGPFLAFDTALSTDGSLLSVLESDTPLYLSREHLLLRDASSGQMAASGTVGYRGRYVLTADGSGTAYLAANVNYLHGIRYEQADVSLRMNTDAHGLLAGNDGNAPLQITRKTSSSGRGASLDLAAGLSSGPWDVGFSGTNLMNRMTWRGLAERGYAMQNLFSGSAHIDSTAATAIGDIRVSSPPSYRGTVAYRGSGLRIQVEAARAWGHASFIGGAEHASGPIQIRGAIALVEHRVSPSAGVSLRVSPRLWVDLATFSSAANLERQQRYALAASLRISAANRH